MSSMLAQTMTLVRYGSYVLSFISAVAIAALILAIFSVLTQEKDTMGLSSYFSTCQDGGTVVLSASSAEIFAFTPAEFTASATPDWVQDPTGQTFTASLAGEYHVTLHMNVAMPTITSIFAVETQAGPPSSPVAVPCLSGSRTAVIAEMAATFSASSIVTLSAGQVLRVQVDATNGNVTVDHASLSVQLISKI